MPAIRLQEAGNKKGREMIPAFNIVTQENLS